MPKRKQRPFSFWKNTVATTTTAAATATYDNSYTISQDGVVKDDLHRQLEEPQTTAATANSISAVSSFPIRKDIDSKLYASVETVDCALLQQQPQQQGCIPCAYKIGCFDVAQDWAFCQACPNQRPEQCPRSSTINAARSTSTISMGNYIQKKKMKMATTATDKEETEIGCISNIEHTTTCVVYGMRPGMNILTVGDGDFTFSLGVARRLMNHNNNDNNTMVQPAITTTNGENQRHGNDNIGDAADTNTPSATATTTMMIATSYETKETLQNVYGAAFDDTVGELEALGVTLLYQIDATRLAETINSKIENKNDPDSNNIPPQLFHRIIWNFPCTAAPSGQDGQNPEMDDNKRLVQQFVQSSRSLLHRGDGELLMAHKTKPPYNQWKLAEIAVQGQENDDESDNSVRVPPPILTYAGRIVMDRNLISPYIPRKALDRKSFPCHDACFFVLVQQEQTVQPPSKDYLDGNNSTTNNGQTRTLFPPTIPPSTAASVASTESSPSFNHYLIPVDSQLIARIRRRHLTLRLQNPKLRRHHHNKKQRKRQRQN